MIILDKSVIDSHRSIEELISEIRASVQDKLPGADDVQTTEIIHELVAGGKR